MLGDVQRHALGDVPDGALELGVGERRDRAATVADEMVVVAVPFAHRFEANDVLADLEPRDQPERLELVEDPVDAGARTLRGRGRGAAWRRASSISIADSAQG